MLPIVVTEITLFRLGAAIALVTIPKTVITEEVLEEYLLVIIGIIVVSTHATNMIITIAKDTTILLVL